MPGAQRTQPPAEPWEGVELPEEHAEVSLSFPFIQWLNGNPQLARVHPVLGSGGFAMPLSQFAVACPMGEIPDGWELAEVTFGSGASTKALLTPELAMAVIIHRFAYQVRVGAQTYITATYQEGARGKLQVLGFVKGLESVRPVMLTFTGIATDRRQDFGIAHALSLHRQQIVNVASAVAQRKFPRYAFWMPLRAGERREVGSGATSFITPVVPGWDTEAITDQARRKDLLRALWVGQDVIEKCKAAWDDAQEWARRWRKEALEATEEPLPPLEEPNGDEMMF